jgi:hypothetical protein
LPLSPLPPVAAGKPPSARLPLVRPPWKRLVRVALVTVLACAAVLLVVLGWYVSTLREMSGVQDKPAQPPAVTVRRLIEAGDRALADGNFQLAAEHLQAAATGRTWLEPAAARQLDQLHRQAALLADLSLDPLDEVIRKVAGTEEAEAQRVFARRFRDKAVVFDAEVRRDAAGRYHLGYVLVCGKDPVRVEIGDLTILGHLPLEKPRRLLIGGRLDSLGREPPNRWVVRLQPDSGVLLTHPGAAAFCCFGAEGGELDEVLEAQQAWLTELP